MILGLTGTNASGKGVFCSIFAEKHGFRVLSLADPLREEAKKRNIELSTRNLITIGNEFRERAGAGALAHIIKTRIPPGDVVIDSIRNPGEVAVLRELNDFFLVALDSPQKIRFEREKLRGRVGSIKNYEEWLEIERIESQSNPLHLQVRECVKLADHAILNDGTKEELILKASFLLHQVQEHLKDRSSH